MRKDLPKLIYAHLTAWGKSGPEMNDPGYDTGAFWAASGLQDILRADEDAPPPRFPGAIGDHNTGMHLFGGIATALFHRERTGEGQLVDAALLRSGIWSMSLPLLLANMGENDAKDPALMKSLGARSARTDR